MSELLSAVGGDVIAGVMFGLGFLLSVLIKPSRTTSVKPHSD